MTKKKANEKQPIHTDVVEIGSRPPSAGQRFPVIVAVRFPPTGMNDVARAAHSAGMKTHEWMRERLSTCARVENAQHARTHCGIGPTSKLPWLQR